MNLVSRCVVTKHKLFRHRLVTHHQPINKNKPAAAVVNNRMVAVVAEFTTCPIKKDNHQPTNNITNEMTTVAINLNLNIILFSLVTKRIRSLLAWPGKRYL